MRRTAIVFKTANEAVVLRILFFWPSYPSRIFRQFECVLDFASCPNMSKAVKP